MTGLHYYGLFFRTSIIFLNMLVFNFRPPPPLKKPKPPVAKKPHVAAKPVLEQKPVTQNGKYMFLLTITIY